jgi:SAM-dependent methyltransferase
MTWTRIQEHYERCLRSHGATPKGVDWPNSRDLEARFATQLSILSGVPAGRCPVLLDLGCGPGLLLDYLRATDRVGSVDYRGVDISPAMIAGARERWPNHPFEVRNIISDPLPEQCVDVVIANGVLTERVGVDRVAMVKMAQSFVRSAFCSARVGVAFNAMTRHVDWEREDLFHWGFDEVAAFLKREVSRHVAIRADYGLYEFTTFVWREPQRPSPLPSSSWWEW